MDNEQQKKTPSVRWCLCWIGLLVGELACVCDAQNPFRLVRSLGRPAVPPGIEYIHRRIGEIPWSIHILRIQRTPQRYGFTTTLAQDHIFGLQSLSDQIANLPPAVGRPVAAVNGDFFVIRQDPYQGDPLGLHIWRGQLVSGPKGTCFWIDATGQPRIGEVEPRMRAAFAKKQNWQIGINEARTDTGVVLYSPTLGPSTRTGDGIEYELEPIDPDHLPLKIGRDIETRIVAVLPGGDHSLKEGRLILSVGPKVEGPVVQLQIGQTVLLHLDASIDLSGVQVAVGGGPVLIQDGQTRQWKGQQPRHPRTAIGFNDENIFLVVVDGRQKDLSAGMTFPELADLMKQLGCKQALNLDGGGSSTFWLDGKIMNSPSDGWSRRIANGLVVLEVPPAEATP